MPLPSFLIIGAGRSGTTSLYHYLGQHPQVFMSPIKETRFFAFDPETDVAGDETDERGVRLVSKLDDYRALFDGVTTETAIGEATPRYLPSPVAPRRMREIIPDARLIAVLRHPVDRAFAAFLGHSREGSERRTFEQVVREEREGISGPGAWRAHWPYLYVGRYAQHLSRYFEHFERDRVRIFLFEDLQADGAGVYRDLCRFIGVDEAFMPDMSVRYNRTGVPASRLLDRMTDKNPVTTALKTHLPEWVRRPAYAFAMRHRNRNLSKPEIPAALRAELAEHFRADIIQLQDLIGRDLSSWLAVPPPNGNAP